MNGFFSLADLSPEQVTTILDEADALQARWQANEMPPVLHGQRVALWSYDDDRHPQTAVEIGVRAMGGETTNLKLEFALGDRRTLAERGATVGDWFTLHIVDGEPEDKVRALAATSQQPVIHAGLPLYMLAKLLLIRRERGTLDGLRVVHVGQWYGTGFSWFELARRLPIHVTQVAPEKYLLDETKRLALLTGAVGSVTSTTDLNSALADVDVLSVAHWPFVNHPRGFGELNKLFGPYLVTSAHLVRLGDHGIYLPENGLTRGREVADDVLRSPRSRTAEAATLLLHVQNAVLKQVVEGVLTA